MPNKYSSQRRRSAYATFCTLSYTSVPPISYTIVRQSPIDLVEWSCVMKAAFPNLIHHLLRMRLVLDLRPLQHGQLGAPAHTRLQLLRDTPLVAREELACKSALARQRRRANLHTPLALSPHQPSQATVVPHSPPNT